MAAPTVRHDAQPDGEQERGGSGHFLLVLGLEQTETLPLPAQGTLSIGRGEDADVRIVDVLASRVHAQLHVADGGLQLEDLGSANGTRLRDRRVPANQRVAFSPGEAINIGGTVLVVQRQEPSFRPRRLWPHSYFETRLIEMCARAASARSTFAVVRIHLDGPDAAERGERTLVNGLRPGDVLAVYGLHEYEVLLVDSDRESSEALTAELLRELRAQQVSARVGVAFFPQDGVSPQALLSRACDLVGVPPAQTNRTASVNIVLHNPAMRRLYEMAERAARGTINVLISGETGVGKEILAETVHRLSPRAQGPFLCLNCAALSETLLESELFGHEKGAFTGAVQAQAGLLEAASGGTLFLDEIGEMSLNLQAKVLRAIETRQVLRVGATRARPVDVRFVAATNRDLDEEVAARRFREDLYFRLGGITLAVPPLRERLDELPALAHLFLTSAARRMGQPPPRLAPETLRELQAYAWPGNIRELRNVMERAQLLATTSLIMPEHLPLDRMRRAGLPGRPPTDPGGLSLVEIEKRAILDALARCSGNQTRAAELLGMPRRTFCKRLSEYNIPRPRD